MSFPSSSSSSSKKDLESEKLLPDTDDKSDVSLETSTDDTWTFEQYRCEGTCHVFYRWSKPTEVKRGIVIGPDWFCSLMAFVALIIPTVLSFLFLLQSQIEEILLYMFFIVAVLSLIVVVLLDPGIVRKHHRSKSKRWTYCDQCASFRPPGGLHCKICQVCIQGYDHHCIWTGKCVGEKNLIVFYVFVTSLLVFLFFVIILLVIFFVDIFTALRS